jgi:phosphoribosylformimino-5-aminoimidazole carboxamide ribotide isomerase
VHGDAVTLARAYAELGVGELYVADLDAIGGAPLQSAIIQEVGRVVTPLWVDAAVSSTDAAHACVTLGATRVVVGLETLSSWTSLREICEAVERERVAFSLDLRDGMPLGALGSDAPAVLAARAVDAGAAAIIVLDLARVGRSGGLDVDLLGRVRKASAGTMLVAGGGVRDAGDLARLADAGCDAALVATALQSGALRLDHVRAAR